MAFDVKAWLKDLGFSDEEQTTLLPQFSTREAELEKHQLRQADYSKIQNDFKAEMVTEREKLATADARLNRELAEWSQVQGAGTAAQAAATKRITTLEQQVLAGRQRVEQIAQASGVDPAEYLKGLEMSVQPPAAGLKPAPADPPAAPDLTGLAKTADIATMNKYMFEVNMALPMLRDEHQALTGEPLDTVALGAEIQRRANAGESMNPREVWETLHDIPAKRVVAEKKTYDAAIESAVERGREAALSEQAIPGGSPAGKHAVIFQPDGEGKPRESKLERPQPNTRTTSAIQALTAHTYRTEGAGAPSGAGASGG